MKIYETILMIFVTLKMDKLFQERSNIDASFPALRKFSQLAFLTHGILANSVKSKSTNKIHDIFQGAL